MSQGSKRLRTRRSAAKGFFAEPNGLGRTSTEKKEVFIVFEKKTNSLDAYIKRAVSPIVTLSLLINRPKYVYEIQREIKQLTRDCFAINMLYPVLRRLEEQGFVRIAYMETVQNRSRSVYEITDAGRQYLLKYRAQYRGIVENIELLLACGEEKEMDKV